MPGLTVPYQDGMVYLAFDRRVDRLEMTWRNAVILWKGIRQAARLCERQVKMPQILADGDALQNVIDRLRDKYACRVDHARINQTYGLLKQAVVGVPTLIQS